MYLMFEKSLKGGFSCTIKKYAKANNQFLPGYNPKLPITHVLYLNKNNLYGGVMQFAFPYRGCRWVRDIDHFDIFANKHKKIVYVLKADLTIPENLHTFFQDLPPLLSHEDFGSGVKLVRTLYPKEKYVIHKDMLKFVIGLGVQVTKIHRVLKFYQKPYLRIYMGLIFSISIPSKGDGSLHKKFMQVEKLLNFW